MVDRDNLYSKSPTRNPNVQRSTSFAGAKLHFSYTGNETKTSSSSREDSSRLKLPSTNSPRLPRQSTFDISQRAQPYSPEVSRRSTYVYNDPGPKIPSEEPLYEPRSTSSRVSQGVPNFYGDASSARMSHFPKDVTVATSSSPAPSSSARLSSTQNLVEAPPATTSPHTRTYGSSSYSAYSSYDPAKKITPADTSPRTPAPPLVPQHSFTTEKFYPQTSPSSTRRIQPTAPSTDHRSRRQTTAFFAPVVPPPQPAIVPERNFGPTQSRYLAAPSVPPLASGPKPNSLNTQIQSSRLASPRRNHLTIGYSSNQFQDIEKAQEEFKALRRKEEEAIRAKLEAKRKAEEEARLAERKRIEEAAKLEARKRVEETARLDAERLALEAMMRAAQPADEDEDVEKFIQNLEQRIKDSRDSKNSNGALVGRQPNQNLAKSAENLTNAPNEIDETVEGRDANDQVSTQSAADNAEFAVLFERLNSMPTDENQNRRKYAENYYDPEEDDSELNSLNSFLSTVTEEDPDMLSVNNQPFTVDPQLITLQPRVITYIHDMVDGIFSSIDKTDIANADTHKMPPLYEQDLYANDAAYNYHAISQTARQFFTPQSSPVEDTKNSFYNDSS